jgi:hypothetical protein
LPKNAHVEGQVSPTGRLTTTQPLPNLSLPSAVFIFSSPLVMLLFYKVYRQRQAVFLRKKIFLWHTVCTGKYHAKAMAQKMPR